MKTVRKSVLLNTEISAPFGATPVGASNDGPARVASTIDSGCIGRLCRGRMLPVPARAWRGDRRGGARSLDIPIRPDAAIPVNAERWRSRR